MKKDMKDVFASAFNKERNLTQILRVINQNPQENKANKLPKYALAAGTALGAGALVYFISKRLTKNNNSLKLELN